jgi:hypothetical protein
VSGLRFCSLFFHTYLFFFIVPSQPVITGVQLLSNGAVAIQWTEPQNPNGLITEYVVYANRLQNPAPVLIVPPADAFSYVIFGLSSDTVRS